LRAHDGTSAEIEWRNGDCYRDLSAVGAGFTIILPARHYQACRAKTRGGFAIRARSNQTPKARQADLKDRVAL
jgi:hypothetical protein